MARKVPSRQSCSLTREFMKQHLPSCSVGLTRLFQQRVHSTSVPRLHAAVKRSHQMDDGSDTVAANGVRRLGHNFVALRAVSQDQISDNWKMVGSEPSRMICLTAVQYRLRAAIYAVQRENGPIRRERLHVAVSRELSVQYPPHRTSGNPIVQIAHEHRTLITLPDDLH